jgi:hypothetical protein
MMKHPVSYTWGRKLLSISILFLIAGTLIPILLAVQSASARPSLQVDTPYPTWYPPAKQTLEAEERQTQAAARLTPHPAGTDQSFLPNSPTPGPWNLTPLPSTPAGDGGIIDIYKPSVDKGLGIYIVNEWSAEIDGRQYLVFAGSYYEDPEQGLIYVSVFTADEFPLPDGGYYLTPTRSGPVQIIGAQGKRLILVSEGGETFFFDVPGQQFAASLTESVPTATSWPITPTPTRTPAYTDDASNSPNYIHGLSPVNTTLSYTINPSGDEDWFRFYMPAPGTLQVELTNLSADYDLYVYGVTFGQYGASTQSGTVDEIVTIDNAPDDDYVVRVVGVDGAFDATHPYQLRFNVPTCIFTVAAGDVAG